MIYVVSNNENIINNTKFKTVTVEQSIAMISTKKKWQFDTETTGIDPHLDKLLCMQFGNDELDARFVIDCVSVDPKLYKQLLESRFLIMQNGKFDLQFLYSQGIVCRNVYDTMIVEQFLYLGYPFKSENFTFGIGYSLKDIAERRLGIELDKTVRGQIKWRGLDDTVIEYAAYDVVYLEKIAKDQMIDVKKQNGTLGAKIECEFTPVIAYLEWCGIKLDEDKWKAKMVKDNIKLAEALEKLNKYCINHPNLKKWVTVNLQGDLFDGFDNEPKFNIDWQKDAAIDVVAALGFNVIAIDKKTKKEKRSISRDTLKTQKGVDDKFLKLFLEYQKHYKVTTSFGQGHLDAINPATGRIHTVYRAIGTATGRMASGSTANNDSITAVTHRPSSYPNMQQLPKDEETRGSFVSEKGNLFCSCDYSAMEARIGAEVYDEKMLLDEFLYRSGDTHAAYAKVVYAEELKDVEIKDIKKVRPDLRNAVKAVEFAVQFGSDGTAVAPQLGIKVDEARKLVTNLLEGMTGLKAFKEKGSAFVRKNGYVEVIPETGHRVKWWDHDKWMSREKSHDRDYWNDYREVKAEYLEVLKTNPKAPKPKIMTELSKHFAAASKWDRYALNAPTQGGGAVCLKVASKMLFDWIVDNGYFNKVLLVNLTHDEINSEFPVELKDVYPKIVEDTMAKAGAMFYHKLPLPAVAECGDHWIH